MRKLSTVERMRRSAGIGLAVCGLALPLHSVLAAQDEAEAEIEAEAEKELVLEGRGYHPPAGSHASQEAETELILEIGHDPQRFIGKRLEFLNGKLIGEVTDVRRKIEDLELYLVVDATPFFNSHTIYAVNGKDLASYTDEAIQMPTDPGMHLRGRVYYPDEYTSVDNFTPKGYEPKPSVKPEAEEE